MKQANRGKLFSADDQRVANGFWVFGYGSLMWDPGFRYEDRRYAELPGYARRFCMWSIHYRGTPEAPGLVLALTETAEAVTQGVAYRVGAADAAAALDYIRERELVSSAYLETVCNVRLLCRPDDPDRAATAITYVLNAEHEQSAQGVDLDAQADIIAARVGPRGPNAEYLFNTVAHLRELGVQDDELERLEEMVRSRCGALGDGAARR